MFSSQEAQPGALSVASMQQRGLDGVELVASVVGRPIELFLRWEHGSLYYGLPVVALSTFFMVAIPGALAALVAVMSMIPFVHPTPAVGLFSLWNFSEAFFLASIYHGFRIWKRVTRMHTEEFSEFEGPPLFIFQYLPWASFWKTRIVFEPLLVVLVAVILQDLYIIQANLAIFLEVSALALFMKSVAVYFRAYCYIRRFMDARNAAPILSQLAQGEVTEDQLAKLKLSAFPKDSPPDIRAQAAVSIARAYSPMSN
jgi:hypothetical protein